MQSFRLKVSAVRCPKSRRKVIHSRINGYDLLVLGNEDVGRSIYFGGSYESAESRYLASRISSDSVCVDIGANIGYFTLLMAKGASEGSVHAFEPIPLNTSLLHASIELNGFTNIWVNQSAVGDRTGEISFVQSSDSAYSSLFDTGRKSPDRTIRVPITTLDEYVSHTGITRVDILKADVEGAEGLVVAGASQLLRDKTRRPLLVLLELYDQNLEAFGSSVMSVVEEMKRLGYVPHVLSDEEKLMPFTEESKQRYYNVWFTPAT